MKPILPCLAVFLFVSAMPAEAKLKGCYVRVYDAAHMASHKGQRVRAMQLQIGFDEPDAEVESEEDLDLLAVKFLANTNLYYAGLECAGTACKTSLDGENLSLAETKNGLTITLETTLRVYEEGGGETKIDIIADAEHKVFALVNVSAKHCEYF